MYWISQQPGNQTSKPSATSRVFCGLQIVYGATARQSSIATLFKNHKKGTKINSILWFARECHVLMLIHP